MLTMDLRDGHYRVLLSLVRYDSAFDDADAAIVAALEPFLRRRLRSLTCYPLGLSPREQQVMELVGQGMTGDAVARRLGCRPRTVDKHLEHIYRKLGVAGRVAAVRACSPADRVR